MSFTVSGKCCLVTRTFVLLLFDLLNAVVKNIQILDNTMSFIYYILCLLITEVLHVVFFTNYLGTNVLTLPIRVWSSWQEDG